MRKVSFLFGALLLAAFTAASASDLPAAAPAAEPAVASSADCQAQAASPLYSDALNEVQTGPTRCGACSSPSCIGLNRGNVCTVPGMPGFIGACDLYSPDPPRCEEGGGLRCICGTGPLP